MRSATGWSRRSPGRLTQSLVAASEAGHFAWDGVAAAVQVLVDGGDSVAALDLLGRSALGDQDPIFWVHLHMAAVELGLEGRAAAYRRMQSNPWPEERQATLRRVVATASTADEAIVELVRHCARRRPHRHWKALLALDFASDAAQVGRWLATLFRSEPPGDDAAHLWFGLADRGDRLYVVGFPEHPMRGDPPPAPTWDPPSRVAPRGALAEVVAIAEAGPDGLGNDAAYPLCLGYAAVAIRLALASWAMSCGPAAARTVLVGFDNGDHLDLGALAAADPG